MDIYNIRRENGLYYVYYNNIVLHKSLTKSGAVDWIKRKDPDYKPRYKENYFTCKRKTQ